MPEYSFYTSEYGGTALDEAAFVAVGARATDLLAGFERKYTISYPTPDSRAKALCAIAEELAAEAALPRGVASVKVGSVSTAYAQGAAGKNRPYQALCRYADVYRGTYERPFV